MKKTIFLLSVFMSFFAFANTEVEAVGGHEEIPLKEIGWQVANLALLLSPLFFLIKKSIKETFLSRQKQFIDQSEKTKSALQNAELALAGIKTKLQVLESGEKNTLVQAAHEAQIMAANLIKESEAQAAKIKADVQLVLGAELEKAKAEISAVILGGAIAATTKKISDKGAQITKESEAEFLRQLGQVKA